MKEEFENSTFDREEVDFTKPGEAVVTMTNLVELEIEGGLERPEDASFDPEDDASRRSRGGEEKDGSFLFKPTLTPADIIELTQESLDAEVAKQGGVPPGPTSEDEGEAKMDE